MKRVLITGASGFLGSHLAMHFRKRFQVFGTYFKNQIKIDDCIMFSVNVESIQSIADVLAAVKPSIIIHCAALSNIDYCEKYPNVTHAVNIMSTENICQMAGAAGIQIVFISTDQVYDEPSILGQACHEFSLVKPLSVYAMSKLKAEERVKELCINYQIVRLSLLYGISGGVNRCFTDDIDEALKKKKPINLFTNQYRTPIMVDDVAQGIEKIISDSPPNETYNLGGPTIISRVDFGKLYAGVFNYDTQFLVPVAYVNVPGKGSRPFNAALDSSKFVNRFKFRPLSPQEGLKKLYLQKMMIIR